MNKPPFLKFMMLLLVVSCYEKPADGIEFPISHTDKNEIKATLVEGRLHFQNKDEFKSSIEYMKSLEHEEVEKLMYDYYDKGFEPLYPFYNENDEVRIGKFVENKQERTNKTRFYNAPNANNYDYELEIEPDDDLINDDYFAGLLNFDREIVIGKKLHKFTHEGVFRVDIDKENHLNTYISENGVNDFNIPDPNKIERGLIQLTSSIERFAPEYIGECSPRHILPEGHKRGYAAFYNDFVFNNGCGRGSTGKGSNSSGKKPSGSGGSSSQDHTETMKNYMKDLQPCDTRSGGIFGWNPFGTSRKCFSYHSKKHRVKTKYWNDNLLFYSSIGVKVKHQRKRLWWGTKKADEVALVINQALFAVTYPNQIPDYNKLPTFSSNNQRLYYYKGKFYDNFSASYAVATGWTPKNDDLVPKTPFSDDIIVQEFIDLPILRNKDDIEIEAKEINKLFWEKGAWSGIKSLMKRFREDPVRMTYIVTTPQKIYLNYIDLTQRKLNVRKITNTLDYDWGGEISLKWGINGNGNWTSNINDWENPLTYFEAFNFTDLKDFESLSMDFVGMTRKGDNWKGSRIVYKKE